MQRTALSRRSSTVSVVKKLGFMQRVGPESAALVTISVVYVRPCDQQNAFTLNRRQFWPAPANDSPASGVMYRSGYNTCSSSRGAPRCLTIFSAKPGEAPARRRSIRDRLPVSDPTALATDSNESPRAFLCLLKGVCISYGKLKSPRILAYSQNPRNPLFGFLLLEQL